jgi:hypothetical protein
VGEDIFVVLAESQKDTATAHLRKFDLFLVQRLPTSLVVE